jgi:adenylate cyclase
MVQDVERKFLVKDVPDLSVYNEVTIAKITQGYLSLDPEIRVRLSDYLNGDQMAFYTVLGSRVNGERVVGDYKISYNDGLATLTLAKFKIKKTRYTFLLDGKKWVVDVFDGCHAGLVMAEVKVSSIDEELSIPSFIGEEVTGNSCFSNSYIAQQSSLLFVGI